MNAETQRSNLVYKLGKRKVALFTRQISAEYLRVFSRYLRTIFETFLRTVKFHFGHVAFIWAENPFQRNCCNDTENLFRFRAALISRALEKNVDEPERPVIVNLGPRFPSPFTRPINPARCFSLVCLMRF